MSDDFNRAQFETLTIPFERRFSAMARLPTHPELVQVAQSAGFLQLQGSDLVFSNGADNSPVYYDFILSCRRQVDSRNQAIAYLAKLDSQTNIVEIQQYRICMKKWRHLVDKLASSDLTIVALSFHIWETILKGKKVLVLVEDWMKPETAKNQTSTSTTPSPSASFSFSSDDDDDEKFKQTVNSEAMEYVIKMSNKHNIVYHIQILQKNNGRRRSSSASFSTFIPKRLAIMLRLMMCEGEPISLDISEKLIKQFHSFVEPRKWFLLWCV